uniref:Uncharacterized protein n=1 Tax=Chlamydomonas leiostraca TaxID=1034604 RepID=A0A7S0WXL0_9CHLO
MRLARSGAMLGAWCSAAPRLTALELAGVRFRGGTSNQLEDLSTLTTLTSLVLHCTLTLAAPCARALSQAASWLRAVRADTCTASQWVASLLHWSGRCGGIMQVACSAGA